MSDSGNGSGRTPSGSASGSGNSAPKGGMYDSGGAFAANLRRMYSAQPVPQQPVLQQPVVQQAVVQQAAAAPALLPQPPTAQQQPRSRLETPGVGTLVASFLSTRDLVSFSQASRGTRNVAELTPVEGSRARLADVRGHFQRTADFTFTGLHGASSLDAPSLYRGVTITGQEGSNFHGTTQLGPGFYMTRGEARPETVVAGEFARNRVQQTGGQPEVFRVYTRGLSNLRSVREDGPALWDATSKPPPKYMRPDFRGSDMVHGDISGKYFAQENRSAQQIKINPHIIGANPAEVVHPTHRELVEKNLDEISQKRASFAIDVRPSPRPDGSLGRPFLNAIKDKSQK